MSFQFRPAVRQQTSLLIGIAGPSSSGKTLSSLRLARGMMGGDDRRIFMIDTEGGRGSHYACAPGEKPGPFRFAFQYGELRAPFSPEAYRDAVLAAIKADAGVIIIDSASHEHEGEGGILAMHEAELDRMAGTDWQKRERVKFAAWIAPKAAHNRYVNALLQQRASFIFAFRAKDKLVLVKGKDGKTEPVSAGWTPICPDRLEYEMTTLLILPPNGKGIPDLAAPATKLQEQHKSFFPPGKEIDERCGELLAEWARGSAPRATAHEAEGSPPSLTSNPGEAQPGRGLFPPEDKPAGPVKTGGTKIPGVDVDDESQRLVNAIEAEKIKFERQPTPEQWTKICLAIAGTEVLDLADPAALHDLLDVVKKLRAGDQATIRRIKAILNKPAA